MPAIFSLPPTKTLDQMNRLGDMGRFPAIVHAGATLNVLLTIAFTLVVFAHYGALPWALPLWVALVLALNLMPVLALRAVGWRAGEAYPAIEQMQFVGDQHRFPDWVYLAASADMAFWIALAWAAYAVAPPLWALLGVQLLALVCTFAPVWLRLLGRGGGAQ
ncbi:hypothetical protein [Acidipila sp. EB88]|uniref:hypothetical protein n=1 Tax=Acidipila sp. EB88 TaxID=2305226 RepID=UPI000F5D63BA|nr:hypothetical protein [Acidipila sp. EB88]RRA48843.1 hypothetical protein D1Y84_11655 [Acidipila sp. EB88]